MAELYRQHVLKEAAPEGIDAHWAWQPVRAQQPPAVADTAWPRTPVDAFIAAGLK